MSREVTRVPARLTDRVVVARRGGTTQPFPSQGTAGLSGVAYAGEPHVRFDEEGRETRDGPLGEWTPDPKGRKQWGAAGPGHDRARPSLYSEDPTPQGRRTRETARSFRPQDWEAR